MLLTKTKCKYKALLLQILIKTSAETGHLHKDQL